MRDSKVKVFEIEASVDTYITLPEPGFTCNCRVILQRANDVIVIPQIAVFESDSMKVVYVVHNGFFEKRQVITGLSSPERTIITKGLKEGEDITLTEPQKEFVKKVTIL
jgi:multidrug efflux pump subunit AcrA (membrane-fusion protein)